MPPTVFDQNYFTDSNTGYTRYERDLFSLGSGFHFSEQIATFLQKAQEKGTSIAQRKVLVLGCAFGYTVEYLVAIGADAYGMDISSYAISQAPAEISARLMVGDARRRADLNAVRSLASLPGNSRFDLIVSEDLLPCFTDAETSAAATEWRRHGNRIAHRISIGDYEGGYTLHTLAEWRALIGLGDWLFNYMTWEEG